jgi:uncharacterized membrane protein SpoIIM required for sporulation
MIIDLQRFMKAEEPLWTELETVLERLESDPVGAMTVTDIKRFQYLYQRASADLSQVSGFAAETDIRRYLASLVGRAYSHVHGLRDRQSRWSPVHWFFVIFPSTFRRHLWAFVVALCITLLGVSAGGTFTAIDKEAKSVILPFPHLKGSPAERVAQEEKAARSEDRLSGRKASFSAYLMTHNTRVSILVFALGFTWGIGTVALLFYNGIILGAVALDYISGGQSVFLLGWLLPHGVIEMPAILIAGQAGLLLAGTLIGRHRRMPLRARFRMASRDLVTLLGGVAVMLVWAGIVESFLSQYHQPVVPYWMKITFGVLELAGLILFLSLSGTSRKEPPL